MNETGSQINAVVTTGLLRRTEVYVCRPREYEISGCECGNDDPDWSEFKAHLWCQRCQIDFQPAQNGIFDGPIPVHCTELLGAPIWTVNLETGEVTKP